jgi:hypothetical protein
MCQIADVLAEAGMPCGMNSVCLYGGTSKGPQISALKSGAVRQHFITRFAAPTLLIVLNIGSIGISS